MMFHLTKNLKQFTTYQWASEDINLSTCHSIKNPIYMSWWWWNKVLSDMNKMVADARLSANCEGEQLYNEIFHHPASAFSKEQNAFPQFSTILVAKSDILTEKCKQSQCARDWKLSVGNDNAVHSEKLSEIEMKIWFRGNVRRGRVKAKENCAENSSRFAS